MELLERLRAETGDRYALLPEPLRTLFLRQRRARRVTGVVTALVMFAAGFAFVWYEYSPPLSPEEKQFIAAGIALMAGAVCAAFAGFLLRDPALWILVDEDLVWIYRLMGSRREQYLVLASDRGLVARLRLDESGQHLDERMAAAAMAAVQSLHPQVHVGFDPALVAAYAKSPASLRRSGTARPRSIGHVLYANRRGLVITAALGAIVIFMFAPALLLSGIGRGRGPLRAPTFADVAMNARQISFTVYSEPGVSIMVPHDDFRRASPTGATRIDVSTPEVMRWVGADARQLSVTVSDETRSDPPITVFVPLPLSIGEAAQGRAAVVH
jgi:hypothetical protein